MKWDLDNIPVRFLSILGFLIPEAFRAVSARSSGSTQVTRTYDCDCLLVVEWIQFHGVGRSGMAVRDVAISFLLEPDPENELANFKTVKNPETNPDSRPGIIPYRKCVTSCQL